MKFLSYGEVYRADWRGITIAVKKLPVALLENPEFLKDFKKEAIIMNSLRHPNVLQVTNLLMTQSDVKLLEVFGNLYDRNRYLYYYGIHG